MNSTKPNYFLLIVHSFPPAVNQNSIRALEIAKNIRNNNFIPIIITRKLLHREPKNDLLVKELSSKIKIIRTPVLEIKKRYSLKTLFVKVSNYIFNIYSYIAWIPFGYFKGKKILKKIRHIKFIFATSPPWDSLIIAFLLKKKFKIPLITELRDPWVFSPYSAGINYSFNTRFQYNLEKMILKSSNMIVTVSDALKDSLVNNFPILQSKPIISVPNGIGKILNSKFQKEKKNEIIITFTGQIYGKRNPDPLFKIISDLKTEGFFKNIKFLFKIFGIYKEKELINKIEQFNLLDLVYLGGYVSREIAFDEIEKCDLAVHLGEDFDYPTIAFKVWDYLSCRKKILYLGMKDSYTSNFLIKNDFGIVIPINNSSQAKKIFKTLINNLLKDKIETTIRKEKLEKFSWEKRFKKLSEHIKENLEL